MHPGVEGGPGTAVGTGGLLERDEAEAAVGAALREAADGGTGALWLVGTAGIGKTALVRRAGRAAAESGFTVASATASPMEAGLPFGLLGQAIIALGGSPVEDADELARLGGRPARFYRTLRWLTGVAAEAPVLLALDDLHWADADSLELLGFLCRRLAGSRVLVLGSLRPEPDRASALAHELVETGHARLLTLEPLSRGASDALATRVLARPLDAAESERLWLACAGTPLLLEVAAESLRAGEPLPVRGDGVRGLSFLLERFVGSGDDAYAYVQSAAIFGVRFRTAFAAALACLDEEAAAAAHLRLVRARLLDDLGGGSAAFVHPLFAQALLDAQTPTARERRHARAFRLLVDAGAPDAVAAEHAAAAHLVGDELAIEVVARAGRFALSQGALAAAVAHLGSAVELTAGSAPPELLLDYAFALVAHARIDEAASICDALLASPEVDAGVRARVLTLLARTAVLANRPDEAERLYTDAVAAAAEVDRETEAATLADAALTCMVGSPVPWVVETTARALGIVSPETRQRRMLEVIAAYAALLGGDPSGVRLIVEAAGAWGEGSPIADRGWDWTLAVHALNAYKSLEDFTGATRIFEREFERAVEDGAPILMNALALAYADAVHRLGRPREALALVDRAAALSEWPMAPWIDIARAALLTELGDDRDAGRHVEALRTFASAMPPQHYAAVSLWLDLLEGRRLLAVGDPRLASETMVHALEMARLTGWLEPCVVPWASVAVDAHAAAGETGRLHALLEHLEVLAAELPCRWPKAVAGLGRARLAAMDGRLDEADAGFESALALLAETPLVLARADALIAQGRHLRRSGRPRLARAPLAEALATGEQCGSQRLVRLAGDELGACGGRRRQRPRDASDSRPSRSGWRTSPRRA